MKKKILLLILLLIPFIVHAEEKTKFSLTDVKASPGSTVTIKFNISNNKEFGVLTARVKYDNTKLDYISGKLEGLKSASIKGIDKNESKSLIAIYAITIGGKLNDTGTLASLEFKINENIKDDIDIPLTLEIVDYGLNEDEAIEYDLQNGVIHVNSNTETKKENTKESLTEKYREQLEEKNLDTNDVTWESSNEDIAKVDDGVVEFKTDGNATVEAKDKDGNVVYSKDYYVKKSKNNKKNNIKYLIIGIVVAIVLIAIFLWRKKCKRKKIKY